MNKNLKWLQRKARERAMKMVRDTPIRITDATYLMYKNGWYPGVDSDEEILINLAQKLLKKAVI